MVTNTKEYMRKYQAARRAKIKLDSLLQVVKNDVKNVKKKLYYEELKPPRMAKVENLVRDRGGMADNHAVPLTQINLTDERKLINSKTLAIDFSYLTTNSSFQRGVMEFIKKYIPGFENVKVRGSKEVIKQSFNENINNYRNVMKELKTVLEARKK